MQGVKWVWAAIAIALVIGCGDDGDETSSDGGVDGGPLSCDDVEMRFEQLVQRAVADSASCTPADECNLVQVVLDCEDTTARIVRCSVPVVDVEAFRGALAAEEATLCVSGCGYTDEGCLGSEPCCRAGSCSEFCQ